MNFYSPPQCVPVTTSPCTTVLPQPYYIPVVGREENEYLAIIAEISDQLDPFCSKALNVFVCHFIHPPCDPDRGIYRFYPPHTTIMIIYVVSYMLHVRRIYLVQSLFPHSSTITLYRYDETYCEIYRVMEPRLSLTVVIRQVF